jgi:hypothetical protein
MNYEDFCTFRTVNNPNTNKYIWLREENMDIGGGKISYDDIDRLEDHHDTERVMISGLRQDTFEYFIEKYGDKVKYISFFKNKLIDDFSMLSCLTKVHSIAFFHNQRVTRLWDMSLNYNLAGLAFDDFSRLHSLDGIQTATNLKHLYFGDKICTTSKLTDLLPLVGAKLTSFSFWGKTIVDNDISIYMKMPDLRYLDFRTNLYSTEQLAQIVASCPQISGYALKPYIKYDHEIAQLQKDVLICGKGKPFLHSKKDAERIESYVKKFYLLVEKHNRCND